MNREQKAAAVEEIAAKIQEADAIFAVDPSGITVSQAGELRTRLREADARLSVVKNTLTLRAADQAGAEALKEHLQGPTALTFVRGDAAAAAKALRDYARQTDRLPFKGGMLNGESLSADDIQAIARLPSREVLYGQLVGVIAHPISGLARTLNALVGGLAIALGQIQEQGLISGGGDGGGAAASGSADAEREESAPAEVPAEGEVVVADEEPDQDAEPASTPEPAQPDQAEG